MHNSHMCCVSSSNTARNQGCLGHAALKIHRKTGGDGTLESMTAGIAGSCATIQNMFFHEL